MLSLLQIICTFCVSIASAQTPVAQAPAESKESQRPTITRRQAATLTALSFGPAWGKDMNNNAAFYSFHAGRYWDVDPRAEVRLSADGALPSKDSGTWLSATLGAAFIFTEDNIAPIAGAEFGFGYANVPHANDPSGFLLGGFVGARLFRDSTTQMSVEGFFQTILDKNNSTMTGLRLGVLF